MVKATASADRGPAASAALIVGLAAARELRGAPLVATVGLGLGVMTAGLHARPHMLALPTAAASSAGLLVAPRSRLRAAACARRADDCVANMLRVHLRSYSDRSVRSRGNCRGPRPSAPRNGGGWTLSVLPRSRRSSTRWRRSAHSAVPPDVLENLSRISECRPKNFSHIATIELALLMLIGLALTRPFAMPPTRAAPLAAVAAMALKIRVIRFCCDLSPDAASEPVAAALVIGAVRLMAPIERVDGNSAPISALAAVPSVLRAKRALNEYRFGGYLIWSYVRPFIDAGAELYGDAMLSLYDKIQPGDPAAIESTLERYDVAWTIFAPDAKIDPS
jgi:hypothetical protein